MKNQKTTVAASVAFAVASFAGAAGAQQLDYWVYSDFAQGDALALQQAFIAEFTAAHPGVSIEISGRGDDALLTGQIAGAASGTGPDVFMNSTSLGAILVEAGALKNIYPEWVAESEEFRAQFSQAMIDLCSPAPEVMYCIPYTGYGSILYRNLDVLEAAGIDPSEPIRDWAHWAEQMAAVSETGAYGIPDLSQDWFGLGNLYSGVSDGNDWGIDFANDRTLLEPEKLAAATQYMIDISPYSTGTAYGDQATTDLFLTNQLAFVPSGPWLNPTLQAAEANGLRYDWVLVPGAVEGTYGGVKGYEFIAISPNENAEISWQFLKHVVDYPQMVRWAGALGRFNSNDAALNDPTVVDHPLLSITNEAVQHAVFNRPPFFVEAYPADYWSVLLDGVAAIVEGDISPEEGAAETIAELDEVIAGN